MFVGCVGLLIAAAGFLAEVPEELRLKLQPTNEVRGVFVQTKSVRDAAGTTRDYVTKGTYRLRPGVDFTWRTVEPFETCFCSTPTNYVYSNEDETVTRKLSELPGFSHFAGFAKGDFSAFFKAFDAISARENGRLYVRAKPKLAELKRVLTRVDLEGATSNWVMHAEFADKTRFSVELKDL